MLHGVRIWHEEPLDRLTVIRAVALVLPAGGVIGGRTAAWLHGADVLGADMLEADARTEVVLPRDTPFAPRAGVLVRRALLTEADRIERLGVPVTSGVRTAFDLARLEPLVEAVTCVDALLHQHVTTAPEIARYAACCRGWRGVRRAATVLEHVDAGAESPMESRLRMVLVLGGLPRPVANQPLRDRSGSFLGRPDLRIGHVLIEYDGRLHRDAATFVADLTRQNRLVNEGYTVLRYTAADLRHPTTILSQVRHALASCRRS